MKITDAVEILKRRYKPTERDLEIARKENDMDDHQDYVERLCKALGIKRQGNCDYHEPVCTLDECTKDICKYYYETDYPTLLHADEVIGLLRKHLSPWDYSKFLGSLLRGSSMVATEVETFVRDYILTVPPTDLVIKACEFVTN
jgi:hypothetical protein